MRRQLKIQIEEDVLESASIRAQQEHKSVADYIETLLRRDLQMPNTSDEVEIFAPDDIRDYHAIPNPGETKEQADLFDRALRAILDRTGH